MLEVPIGLEQDEDAEDADMWRQQPEYRSVPLAPDRILPIARKSVELSRAEITQPAAERRNSFPKTAPLLETTITPLPAENIHASFDHKPEAVSPPPAPEKLETHVSLMNLAELVAAAQSVMVGGESLATVYQQGRIDQTGLRHVLAEKSRGGNPEAILIQEKRLHELRHQSPEFLLSSADKTTQSPAPAPAPQPITDHSTTIPTNHMLPAYDDPVYPSDTQQLLLPADDTAMVTKRRHYATVITAVIAGMIIGVILAALILG